MLQSSTLHNDVRVTVIYLDAKPLICEVEGDLVMIQTLGLSLLCYQANFVLVSVTTLSLLQPHSFSKV